MRRQLTNANTEKIIYIYIYIWLWRTREKKERSNFKIQFHALPSRIVSLVIFSMNFVRHKNSFFLDELYCIDYVPKREIFTYMNRWASNINNKSSTLVSANTFLNAFSSFTKNKRDLDKILSNPQGKNPSLVHYELCSFFYIFSRIVFWTVKLTQLMFWNVFFCLWANSHKSVKSGKVL